MHIRTGFDNIKLVQRALAALDTEDSNEVDIEIATAETKSPDGETSQDTLEIRNDDTDAKGIKNPAEKKMVVEPTEPMINKYKMKLPLLVLDVVDDLGQMLMPLLQLRLNSVSAKYVSMPNYYDQITAKSS